MTRGSKPGGRQKGSPTQLGLYDRYAPYVKGSATSKEAAESHTDKELSDCESIVLTCIRRSGVVGRTDDEVCVDTADQHKWPGPHIVGARRGALAKRGLIVNTGRRRKTRTGRDAYVWVAKEHESAAKVQDVIDELGEGYADGAQE